MGYEIQLFKLTKPFLCLGMVMFFRCMTSAVYGGQFGSRFMIENATGHFTTLPYLQLESPASQTTRRHRPQHKRCLLRCPRLQRWIDRWRLAVVVLKTGVLIICLYLRRWLKGGVPSNESVDVLLGKRKGNKRSGHKDQETHLPPSNCPCSLCHLKLHHIIRNSMRGNATVPTFLLMQVCH